MTQASQLEHAWKDDKNLAVLRQCNSLRLRQQHPRIWHLAPGTYEQRAAITMHHDPFLMMTTVLMAASAVLLLGLGMGANKQEGKDKTEATKASNTSGAGSSRS